MIHHHKWRHPDRDFKPRRWNYSEKLKISTCFLQLQLTDAIIVLTDVLHT